MGAAWSQGGQEQDRGDQREDGQGSDLNLQGKDDHRIHPSWTHHFLSNCELSKNCWPSLFFIYVFFALHKMMTNSETIFSQFPERENNHRLYT